MRGEPSGRNLGVLSTCQNDGCDVLPPVGGVCFSLSSDDRIVITQKRNIG